MISKKELKKELKRIIAIYESMNEKKESFTEADVQIMWEGVNITRSMLIKISANEGLAPYEALAYANFDNENIDLSSINEAILSDQLDNLIKSKSRWDVLNAELTEEIRG